MVLDPFSNNIGLYLPMHGDYIVLLCNIVIGCQTLRFLAKLWLLNPYLYKINAMTQVASLLINVWRMCTRGMHNYSTQSVCNGYSKLPTYNLDMLKYESLLGTNCFCSSEA